MKAPSCVMQVRPDKTAIICGWCPDKIAGDTWAGERGYEISHAICPRCNVKVQAALVDHVNLAVLHPKITEEELLRKLNGETL